MGFASKLFCGLALAGSLIGACTSRASGSIITYNFACITNTTAGNGAAGESQLFVTIAPIVSGQVSFTFHNTGPLACSITDVYMQDGPILGLATVVDGTGVDFEQGATPHNLPGANLISPAFTATESFSAQSAPPSQPNGVNPGEVLELDYTLISGKTVADVNNDLQSGALRIGIHVQGFSNGGSESFVNHPNPTPTPGALAILAMGGVLVTLRRR